MGDNKIGHCGQKGCNVSKTGTCMEGHSLDVCPHYISPDEDQSDVDDIETSEMDQSEDEQIIEIDTEMVFLHDGEALDLRSTSNLAKTNFINLVVIAGAPQCGKTTLLLSIYDCFSEKSFSNYYFAGSHTLVAYEKYCFLSRIESGARKPSTERTIPEDNDKYLHLKVFNSITGNKTNLLLTDISGEVFLKAKDSDEICKNIISISICDHFVLLIDGEKLIDPGERQKAYLDAIMLLRRCYDSKMLRPDSNIYILISKWDIVEGITEPSKKEDALNFINYVEKNISDRFKEKFSNIKITKVSARPLKADLPHAYGIDKLFSQWVETCRKPEYSLCSSTDIIKKSEREFDHYIYKSLN